MKHAEFADVKGAHLFSQSVLKAGKRLEKFEDHIAKLHHAIRKDNVSELKGVLEKHIPREGMFLINGLEIPGHKIALPLGLDDLEINTKRMSMLECACVLERTKVFKYLIEEAHVRHSRDFNISRANQRISEQLFIFVPFLKKDWVQATDLL